MLEPRQGIGGWRRMGQEMGQDILDNWRRLSDATLAGRSHF
jgi:hypothetical protein